jgi:hypothetical protein
MKDWNQVSVRLRIASGPHDVLNQVSGDWRYRHGLQHGVKCYDGLDLLPASPADFEVRPQLPDIFRREFPVVIAAQPGLRFVAR